MVSTRRRIRSDATAKDSPTQTRTFQTLISAFQSSEGLKPPFLKSLYCILVNLSLKGSTGSSDNEGSPNFLDGGFKIESKDIGSVAERLFEELDRRFESLFSALSDVYANRENGHVDLGSDVWANVDELILLLRCSMEILTLVDQDLVFKKFQVLFSILRNLKSLVTIGGDEKSPVTFKKSVYRECRFSDATSATSVSEDFVSSISILEPSDPCRPFLCAVLEAFADELLTHRFLRKYFMLADSTSCTSRALFRGHFLSCGIGSVLEAISIHFILSFSDELGFENFLNRLSCRDCKDIGVPKISLNAAMSLLLNPIVLSAPKMFQAHLILLISEVVGASTSSANVRPSVRLMASYLTAFERSVILYTGYMSTSLMDGHPIGSKGLSENLGSFGRSVESSFEHHIHEVTNVKICDVVCKSDLLWNSHLCNMFCKEKPNLLAESTTFINESQPGLDESCKKDMLLILNSIIVEAFSDSINGTVLCEKGETSQHICLLAAILKLISTSLSTVFWCLRNTTSYGCLKALEDASLCKEYDFIMGVIGCFRQFSVSLPNQKKLFEIMKSHLIRHKTTKWMLLHFSGLLSLTFASGFDFLVKNCVSVIQTLMNLYVFEEGNVVALRSLLVPVLEPSSQEPPDKVEEALVDQKLSQKIVSKFQKIQTMYLRSEDEIAGTSQNASILKCTKESTFGIEEETEESYNGKVYLQYVTKNSCSKPDYDMLADFVEFKPGKDYSKWLKDRERFRTWRSKKMAVVRWKKKKRTWNFMVGNKALLSEKKKNPLPTCPLTA